MPTEQEERGTHRLRSRLMPAVRRIAEQFSQKEGVLLSHFINAVVAEKLAQLQHEEWLRCRLKPCQEAVAHALAILDSPTLHTPEVGDELPEGYVPLRSSLSG